MKIDEDKCVGCGLCTTACQEGALQLVNGKAKLISDSYCDGLGKCIPNCPVGAITIEQRDATPFDKEMTPNHLAEKHQGPESLGAGGGCPGSRAGVIEKKKASSQMQESSPRLESQ